MEKVKMICPFMSRVLVLRSKAELHTVDCGKETCELWIGGCAMGSKATKKTAFYRWVAVMDEFTCDECKARHDEIFSMDSTLLLPPLHDKDDDHPLACRCVIEKVNDDED